MMVGVKRPEGMSGSTLRTTSETGRDGERRITLAGAIDENSDLAGLFALISGPSVINMREVARVNSMGIHAWIPAIAKASAAHPVVIEELSYALVQNANVVANLFGSAQVRSCMAPYYCSKCKDNVNVSVSADEVLAAGDEPPTKHCTRCKAELEFDELDGYFVFFKSHRAV
jgi:hypothetical protein